MTFILTFLLVEKKLICYTHLLSFKTSSSGFLKCVEKSPKGKERTFTWITSFKITQNNVLDLMKGARSRWKIENETFNTLKNQGYHFEHNYGHGYKNLSTILANLMMLAFLVDQIQQLSCPIFLKALNKCFKKKSRLWARVREWFFTFFIDSWGAFYCAIESRPELRLTKELIDSS